MPRSGTALLKVYDTSLQTESLQFDYWREELCHNFVELAPERFEKRGAFSGQITQQSLDAVSVSRVSAEGHCVNRTAHEIGRSSQDCYFANLQLVGRGRTRQDGIEVISEPGDLVLVNAGKPYDITHDEPFDLISIKLPSNMLADRLALKRGPKVPHIAAERGFAPVLRSYTFSILHDLDTDVIDSAPYLAENLADLVASAVSAAQSSANISKLGYQQQARLQAILDHIKLHLADPAMCLAGVCARFRLSPRYIQKLFSNTGCTFSQTVLNWRLEHIAVSLRGSRENVSTLTELAYAWGFNDFTYFSRTFKRRFGITARDYRARHRVANTDSTKILGGPV